MYGYYFDHTYILLVIGMVLSLAASARVKSTFAIYNSAQRIGTDRSGSRFQDPAYGRDHRCVGSSHCGQSDRSL